MSTVIKIKDFSNKALEQGKGYTATITALITNVVIKQKKSGGEYWAVDLSDKTGSITLKKWNKEEGDENLLKRGSIVTLEVTGDNYNNKASGTFSGPIVVEQNADIRDYINSIMINVDMMIGKVNAVMDELSKNPNAKVILNHTLRYPETFEKFCKWPGGKTNHHNVEHGLLMHSYCVMSVCTKLAKLYDYLYPGQINLTVLQLAALIHDYGKLQEYTLDAEGNIISNDAVFSMNPHPLSTVLEIERINALDPIDDDFRKAVEHCILSHHGEPDKGAVVEPHTLEAIILNAADEIDANMYSALMAMKTLDVGEICRASNGKSVMRLFEEVSHVSE